MKLKFSYLVGLISSITMVSCYPPVPPQPKPIEPVVEEEKPSADEEGLVGQALRDFRISQGRDPETGKPLEPGTGPVGPTVTNPIPTNPRPPVGPTITQPTPPTPPVPQPDVEPKSYPYATPVPGKQGFVFNPYTNVKVDVRGLPSGTIVTDPRNPNQKFYVP